MIDTLEVQVTNEHLQKLMSISPLKALAELIWNALDTDATDISVTFKKSDFEVNTTCPYCEQLSLVQTDSNYKCINCLQEFENERIDRCVSCGDTFKSVDDEIICSICLDNKL